MKTSEIEARLRGHVRKAKDCLITMRGADPKDMHRAVEAQAVEYRLQEITNDGARAVGTAPGFSAPAGMRAPWHYHDCDMQIGVVLGGSVEGAYADQERWRIGKSDIIMVPGGAAHDVSEASADYEATEFTFPGTFATIESKAPPRGTSSTAVRLGINEAIRSGAARGLLFYDYPVSAPYSARYAVGRQRRSRVEPFVQGQLVHDAELLLLYVTQGSRTVVMNGEQTVLERGDLLVLPGGVECRDVDASEEHESLSIRLLHRSAAN
jgi:quercetin dioxygenase-like cupin family protein